MSGGARLLVGLIVGVVLVMTVSVGLAAASIARGGTVAVEMHEEDGSDVSVLAPAALLDLALLLVPDGSLTLALEHGDISSEPALEHLEEVLPALRDAWDELVDAPDFTVVEVKGPDHRILVDKRAQHLMIHVEERDASFDIKVPLATVTRALQKL